MSAGSDVTNGRSAEIYTPPYLLTGRPRPQILEGPATMRPGPNQVRAGTAGGTAQPVKTPGWPVAHCQLANCTFAALLCCTPPALAADLCCFAPACWI